MRCISKLQTVSFPSCSRFAEPANTSAAENWSCRRAALTSCFSTSACSWYLAQWMTLPPISSSHMALETCCSVYGARCGCTSHVKEYFCWVSCSMRRVEERSPQWCGHAALRIDMKWSKTCWTNMKNNAASKVHRNLDSDIFWSFCSSWVFFIVW